MKRIKGYGEVAKIYYEDADENGLLKVGMALESEEKGTILKVEKILR